MLFNTKRAVPSIFSSIASPWLSLSFNLLCADSSNSCVCLNFFFVVVVSSAGGVESLGVGVVAGGGVSMLLVPWGYGFSMGGA